MGGKGSRLCDMLKKDRNQRSRMLVQSLDLRPERRRLTLGSFFFKSDFGMKVRVMRLKWVFAGGVGVMFSRFWGGGGVPCDR